MSFPPRQSHYSGAFRSPTDSYALRTEQHLQAVQQAAREQPALQQQQQQQQATNGWTDSARSAVPSLALGSSRAREYDAQRQQREQHYDTQQQSQQPQQSSQRPTGSVRRPASAQPQSRPQAVGVTLVPTTEYRPPSGTSLNKIPHSARVRDQLARDQLETRERLRAKALDRRIKDAVLTQELTRRAQEAQTSQRRAKSATQRAKSARASQRANAQAQAQQSFLTQQEIEALQRPYETMRGSASQQQLRPTPYEANILRGSQSQAQLHPTVASSSPARPFAGANGAAPFRWGPAYEPADRPGQPVSSSAQSRLSAADIAAQPVAGAPSGNFGKGNDLAAILGGGHSYLQFGNKNAPSAQTRVQVPGVPRSPVPNKTLYTQGESPFRSTGAKGASGSPQARGDANYAPYATTVQDASSSRAPRKFNDDTGALLVRDPLSDEPRHAPAAIGFGRGHWGYKEYVDVPCAASRHDTREAELQDPFKASKASGILSWNSDGIERGGSRKEVLAAQQRQAWARTQGDRGGPAAGQAPLDRESLPVAGATKGPQEPFRLWHDQNDSMSMPYETEAQRSQARAQASVRKQRSSDGGAHVHGPGCGHSHAPVRAFANSNGNPLAYSGEEVPASATTTTTRPPVNLAASSIGFGRKHDQYKSHVLAASANLQRAEQQ